MCDVHGETCLHDRFDQDPGKRSGRRPWILAAVVCVGALIAAGTLIGTPKLWARSLPPRKAETAEEKWRKTAAAFAENPAPVEHAELPAIQKLLERYGAALRNRDVAAVREAFDFGRMVQELERLGALDNTSLLERVLLPGQFGAKMPNQFVADALFYEFDRFETRRLDFEGESEAVVYARHWSALGQSKYRWWMRKSDGRWRLFDFEELETVERFTDFMVAAVRDVTPARAAAMQRAAASVGQVFRAIAEEDWDQAEQIVGAINIADLPPAFQVKVHMAQATVHIAFGRCEQALEACDRAAALSDMPILSYQRAVSYNALGRHEDALAAAKQYVDRLGSDSDVLREMGVALAWLGRSEEALEAYRRGLRHNPDDASLLLELGVSLQADAKSLSVAS